MFFLIIIIIVMDIYFYKIFQCLNHWRAKWLLLFKEHLHYLEVRFSHICPNSATSTWKASNSTYFNIQFCRADVIKTKEMANGIKRYFLSKKKKQTSSLRNSGLRVEFTLICFFFFPDTDVTRRSWVISPLHSTGAWHWPAVNNSLGTYVLLFGDRGGSQPGDAWIHIW